MASTTQLIDQIPIEVRDYLTAGDGLGMVAVHEQYPHVDQVLRAPSTRVALLNYLASQEPWHDPPGLTIGALVLLKNGASAAESQQLLHLLEHPIGLVRLRLYQYLVQIYYPSRNMPPMIAIFQKMLADPDEVVRVQAARWIQGFKLGAQMRPTLEQWTIIAAERKWNHGESYDIIQGLLRR